MGRILATLLFVTLLARGYASRYDPGVFESVVRVRQSYGSLPTPLPPHEGYIALLDCGRVGDVVTVCHGGECLELLVADCAGIADGGRDWMIQGGYAGEVDARTSRELGSLGEIISVYELPYHPSRQNVYDYSQGAYKPR